MHGKMGLRNYSTNLFLSSKNESFPELNVLVYVIVIDYVTILFCAYIFVLYL